MLNPKVLAPKLNHNVTITSGMGALMMSCGLQFALSEQHRWGYAKT